MILLPHLSNELGVSCDYINMTANTAHHRYKIYYIEKNNGGRRKIHHPSRVLKLFQRWISDNIINKLPVSGNATAYKRGASAIKNAGAHRLSHFILKMDFENFFESISKENVLMFLQKNKSFISPYNTKEDIELITKFICKGDSLVIGSPSSPFITNAIMKNFDDKVASYCNKHNVVYTRYSDDMTFSCNAPNILSEVEGFVKNFASNDDHIKLVINENKTVHCSPKMRRHITGINITPDHKLSIGRKKKRYIRSLIYKSITNTISDSERKYLYGMLCYVNGVEPIFMNSLREKYGESTISDLMTHWGSEDNL